MPRVPLLIYIDAPLPLQTEVVPPTLGWSEVVTPDWVIVKLVSVVPVLGSVILQVQLRDEVLQLELIV